MLVWATRRGPGARWQAGALGVFALSLAALGVFLLDFARGDPAPLIAGFRADVAGAALVLAISTAAWAVRVARGAPPAPATVEADPSPVPPDAGAPTTDSATNA